MRKSWTVLHLQLMLHYHTRGEPYAKGTAHGCSAATVDYRQELIELEMLVESDHTGAGYKTTEKGRAFVEALKHVSEPVAQITWRVELSNER